ncbi:MAG: LytR C-terminal domain-containing protein [Acidimicrobiales bacterium]|nr:LytR C-terminal domain-containing protein [Acidimicrobiales bacterium]
MTAPDHSTSGFDSNTRGLAVLAVAVVVGLLLLLNAGNGGAADQVATNGSGDGGEVTDSTIDVSGLGDDDDESVDESTTTTPDQTTTSSVPETTDTRPPNQVKVLVLNGCGSACPGVAGTTSASIGETGFVMQQAGNASARPATTVVYFAESYQADAEAVAAVMGKAPDVVEAMPSTSPGPGAENANVVVVLGADTPPASGN